MKPTRYWLEWDAGNEDHGPILQTEDIDGFHDRIKDRALELSREHGQTILWSERVNIEDVTPPEDPPGLIWDWEERLVMEITAPELFEHDLTCTSLLPVADFYHCDCSAALREGATR